MEGSLVDAANPCVFVRASELGLDGTELPDELSATPGLLDRLERIRGTVCARLGMVDRPADAADETPTTPFIAMVAPPLNYECSVDRSVEADAIDVTARIVTTGTPHHAYAMTGAMCLGAATRIPGTIPNEVVRTPVPGDRVTIGHPKGTIDVGVEARLDRDHPTIESVTVSRTARPVMAGEVYYRYVDGLERLR
jgi:2-methylaconitate cis-trans-isomerase PrpF